jgi:hypothetical protein
LRQDLCQELKLEALQTACHGSPAEGDGLIHWTEVAMPQAMVSIAVLQIAPGTIGHGVRLIEDRMPRSGSPRAPCDLGCAVSISAEGQTSLQFLRDSPLPNPHAHRNFNAGNPHQDAPAK